jgi:thioredoxin 1
VSDPVPAENRADATYTVLIYTQTNQGNGLLSDIVIIQNDDEIVYNVPVFIEWYEKKYRRPAATAAPAPEAAVPEEKVPEASVPEEKMATIAPVPEVTARAPTVVPEEVAPVPEEPPVPPETAANLNPVNVSSAEEFNRLVEQYPVAFVKFTASWCGPCQTIQPTWVGLSRQYASSNNVFIEVDIEYNPGLSDTYDVRQIPTFLVFKDKKGYKPATSITKFSLEQMVREHSAK